jgi:hypothetical protein
MKGSLQKRFLCLMAGIIIGNSPMASGQDFRGTPSLSTETASQGVRSPLVSLFGKSPVKVMLIGDSLSFGPFGERLEQLLKDMYGEKQVCVFASCASSPESWLNGTPIYMTKCGYRQYTPNSRECYSRDFYNGRAPRPVATPKLGMIFSEYRPNLVIVQQGTNWMDQFNPKKREEYLKIGRYMRDMVTQIRSKNPEAKIIWILPPAASKYSQIIQSQIASYIRRCGETYRFRCIDSRRITGPYIKGISGRDGVHYSEAPARAWADMTFLKIKALVDL